VSNWRIRWLAVAVACGAIAYADVLPDDRADALWHYYGGGGITVEGPSLLVRKKIGDNLSVAVNYYVDMITSASIDVVTEASPYKEIRRQETVSADYLRGKTTYSGGFIDSVEPDYNAKTGFLAISQSMFGDLTTVSMGYTRGWDIVGKTLHGIVDPDFHPRADRRNWSIGVTQVLTRNLLASLNFETDESEGYLQNPYREARYFTGAGNGYSFEPQIYPHTHTSNAASLELKYYLPWRAALTGDARVYEDTWGVAAEDGSLKYMQPLKHNLTIDTLFRYYSQTHATFYSDLFPYANSQNFVARDRELASFRSMTLGAGISYQMPVTRFSWLDKATVNLSVDHLRVNYLDFRDDLVSAPTPAQEPLYVLSANVVEFFISAWY
jgi:hypothetical protein